MALSPDELRRLVVFQREYNQLRARVQDIVVRQMYARVVIPAWAIDPSHPLAVEEGL